MDHIEHEKHGEQGAFFMQRAGKRLAEINYRHSSASKIIVTHTGVDASLAGQGIGRALLDALVHWARKTGIQIVPQCSFVVAQFKRDATLHDVLAAHSAE